MNSFKGWLICFVAACFFSYELVQLHMMNALAPHLMKDLSLSATQFGALSSTYLLADVIFLVPAGIIIDRFSLRKVLLFALGFCVIGTFGIAFSKNLYQACICHFFSGIGNAFCFLSCMILANGWFKQRSTFVMSLMVTFGLLGAAIAQVPFSVMAEKLSWRNALLVDGVIGMGIWVLNYLFVEDPINECKVEKSTKMGELLSDFKQACKISQTWSCGFYTAFMNLPLMIISAMVGNLFLTHVHGFSQTHAAMAISMISIGTIVASPIFGYISEKIGSKKQLMVFGAIFTFIVFMSLIVFDNFSLYSMIAIFFLIGFFSATQVLGYPMITDAAPQPLKGTAMGVAALIIMGTAFVLQPITGLLLDSQQSLGVKVYTKSDFTRAFMLFPVVFAISTILALKLREPKVVKAQN